MMKEVNIYDDSVSLNKVVTIIEKKLGVENCSYPYVEYSKPLNFYIREIGEGSKLKFSAQELFESCNRQDLSDIPLFEDIPDMMNELKDLLGGDPLELVVKELKANPNILTCVMKLR